MSHICTHPDHNDKENCEDRAVGCSKHCTCCLGESATPVEGEVRQLSNYEILLIRACKSEKNSTLYRYRQIMARRVDIPVNSISNIDLASWMLEVLIKHELIGSVHNFILNLNENCDFWHTTQKVPSYNNFNKRLIGRCESAFMTTPVSKLNGYRSPLRIKLFLAANTKNS